MKNNSNQYRSFEQIVNLFYNEALESIDTTIGKKEVYYDKIKIEPKLIIDSVDEKIKLEIFIGNETMYKIKKLSEFYERMMNGENYKYGDKLEFIHTKEVFKNCDLQLLDFVLKYAEIIKYGNSNTNSNYRFGAMLLSESQITIDCVALDSLFEILKNKIIRYEKDSVEKQIKIEPNNPYIKFVLSKTDEEDYKLIPNVDMFKLNIIYGKKYKYVLIKDVLYRCSKDFDNTTMRLVEAFRKNYSSQVRLRKEQLTQLFSVIVPKIKNGIVIEVDKEEIKQYLPKELITRLYIDFDRNNYLIANLKFVYDGVEYNPLEEFLKKVKSRNIIQETKALNLLRETGFMLDAKNLRFVLTDDDKIYKFVTEEVETYMKSFEVLATENYKTKQIKQPKISSLGVKIENNLLELDLANLNIDTKELISIIEKYKIKKKYHRLKDGTFLKLDENDDVEFLSKLVSGADINYKELSNGIVRMPMHRTLYLNQLLDALQGTKVKKNDRYNDLVNKLDKENLKNNVMVPFKMNNILRNYQKVGIKWLKELDNYHFGGILADDMGLGKTIQLLAVILAYKGDNKIDKCNKKASLVVSPSSLALNWESEAEKFAPELKTLVISGASYERKRQIQLINKYDLIITSYDLLKRDIEYYNYKKYQFKYVIADEAQYLKNSSTQNAMAIKQIQAETRYALTGTPMENSLAELWSIFDFIMPGYLFSYKKFKNLYESPIVRDKDETIVNKLKMMIEPFILRRTKKEVLTELPEKTVTVLTSDMQDQQKSLYMSYLVQAKEEIRESIELNGLEKSHIRILAVLTRLRQICCHPSVFIDNYEGGSSKLDQCMELVKNGVESGHKILLFSGYTSMFPIIEKKLRENEINYYKLTGATKVSDRIKLVDDFNSNDKIKVFLISLKAGGTGLNLIGADMVIHYDPWWNASAENQATDRAYRIGQVNNVQVFKLITKDSIEEKIYELQQNKSALIDNMLDINTSFVKKLSRDEIMQLFE